MHPHNTSTLADGQGNQPVRPPLFIVSKSHRNLTEDELLTDLKNAAAKTGGTRLSVRKYEQHGQFAACTICKHFGTWNRALRKAGLVVIKPHKISDAELFKNMETVWLALGRQPKYYEMRKPLSRFSGGPYTARFKTWHNALVSFAAFMNARNSHSATTENESEGQQPELEEQPVIKHKTKRQPSEKLKVQVLMRDGNHCRLCGKKLTGDNIHFDHIIPWSRGGETVLENLQVLCKKHNAAKGSLV